jgi:tetratricopeptide (TPR) repeat protein
MKTLIVCLVLLLPAGVMAAQDIPHVCREAEALSKTPEGDSAKKLNLYEQCLDNELSPMVRASVLFNMGVNYADLGQWSKALAHYEEAVRFYPDDYRVYNNMALILASCSDPSVRDGERALELSRKACALSSNLGTLDTYATALARVGQFDEAASLERKLIRQARTIEGFPVDILDGMQDRLALYVMGTPYTEPAPSPAE